jgi:hypothetical protein
MTTSSMLAQDLVYCSTGRSVYLRGTGTNFASCRRVSVRIDDYSRWKSEVNS